MQESSRMKSKIIFGALAAGGLILISKLTFDFLKRSYRKSSLIKPIYIEGVKMLAKKDLISLLGIIHEKTKEEVTKTILYFRILRRNAMDDIDKYESLVQRMEHKLEKIINAGCLLVLQENDLSLPIFERSIEYYNDDAIHQMIEHLTVISRNKDFDCLNPAKLLSLLNFYEKIQKSILESTDIQAFDSSILSYQIEDKIWQEFNIEVNDIDWSSASFVHEGDLKKKLIDISQYMVSIQKLNRSLFK